MRELENKVAQLENELADLYTMSEEAACFRYNVDYKQEAIDILTDDLNEAYKALEEAEIEYETENADWHNYGLDPAFSSWSEFNKMRVIL